LSTKKEQFRKEAALVDLKVNTALAINTNSNN